MDFMLVVLKQETSFEQLRFFGIYMHLLAESLKLLWNNFTNVRGLYVLILRVVDLYDNK